MSSPPVPEFSRVVELAELPGEGADWKLSATPGERAAIAARLGLSALERLDAAVRLSWIVPGKTLKATGRIRARVVQRCVVTLDPVTADLDAPLDVVFVRDGGPGDGSADRDAAEPLVSDRLDIGDLVTEELSLDLDPYPRSPDAGEPALGPGAGLRTADAAEPPEPPADGPFKALERLKETQ